MSLLNNEQPVIFRVVYLFAKRLDLSVFHQQYKEPIEHLRWCLETINEFIIWVCVSLRLFLCWPSAAITSLYLMSLTFAQFVDYWKRLWHLVEHQKRCSRLWWWGFFVWSFRCSQYAETCVDVHEKCFVIATEETVIHTHDLLDGLQMDMRF